MVCQGRNEEGERVTQECSIRAVRGGGRRCATRGKAADVFGEGWVGGGPGRRKRWEKRDEA